MMNNETKLCAHCGTKPVAKPSDARSIYCGYTCSVTATKKVRNTDDGYDAYRDMNRGAFGRWGKS